jgi:hypothetical protein
MGYLPEESKSLASGITGLADNSVVYAAPVGFHKVTTITSDANTTLTADAVLGGVIERSGMTSDRTDTMPTCVQLLAQMKGAQVGTSVEFCVQNTDASHHSEISLTDTGITAGNSFEGTVQDASTHRYLLIFTNVTPSSEAATIYLLGVGTTGTV